MGQEYWLQFKTNSKQVNDYLLSRNFPKDILDGKTLIIASDKTKTDCWLSWEKGIRLEIASQIFDDQSAWCAAIVNRLHELFGASRAGADSTGWWKKGEFPSKPFTFTMKAFKHDKKFTIKYNKLQRLFINEAKRLLPKTIMKYKYVKGKPIPVFKKI